METFRNYRRRGTADFPVALYMASAGVNMTDHPNAEHHPEPEIALVTQGNVTMQISGVSTTFQAGDIFIIPPNTVHRRSHYSQDASVRTFVFSPEAIRLPPEHFFQQAFVQPLAEGRLIMPSLLQPDHPAYAAVKAQFCLTDSCRIYEKDFKIKRFSILMNICTTLMPYCQVIAEDHPLPDPGNEAVKQAMRCIHNNYFHKLTLKAISKACYLHPNYLCAVFKAYTGQTVFAYLSRYRIEVAAGLLQKENIPIHKVAELTGFRSESLFYQKFKEIMGTTPKAYAKQRRNG